MCIGFTANAQLTIPKKKCTRGKCYFVDQTNKRISDYYEDVKEFQEGLAAVNKEGKWGYVNEWMTIIIPLKYQRASDFNEGLASVKLNNESFLIDAEGNSKSEKYDSIGYISKYIVIKKNNKLGLLTLKGKLKEAPQFDRISAFYNNDFGVQVDGKWANFNNGNLNYNNPTIYYASPEEMPVYSKSCINTEDLESRKACSNKEMLTKIYQSVRYPIEARKKGIQGEVIIRFLVNNEGVMENPEIVKNVGGGCGEQAFNVVKTYLKKWALPGKENGQPINTVVNLPVKFNLE